MRHRARAHANWSARARGVRPDARKDARKDVNQVDARAHVRWSARTAV